ncbi:hypothetical protein JH06_1895 [Blastocystis sp. subtype 4]|uniref:hypothetical protein n=1 Tax=Blastocystis sp. subtype 4 TaxID=944170 RepID=UPI00071188E6|nr:hypothetical protein JH06_1895 [Blastocystis sp. subtype 4]KNB44166.1 hypothetical protein JH06_1895 [Blastocystis sp. subtype 4]|eukprot:XP_014527609.1 hypothetical protein JH06_1895 [Blastocystis sp. subtype 4]
MDPELEAFLKDNKEFQLNDHGKVHCNLTNHDIVATMAEVKKHMQTEKYQHAKDWYNYDYSKYLPYIQEHRSDPKKLFCIVTMTSINKIPAVVERTVNSKKFKRLCAQYEKRKRDRELKEQNKGKEEEEIGIDEMLGLVDAEENENDGSMSNSESGEEVNSDSEVISESEDGNEEEDEENPRKRENGKRKGFIYVEGASEEEEEEEEEEVRPPKKSVKRSKSTLVKSKRVSTEKCKAFLSQYL